MKPIMIKAYPREHSIIPHAMYRHIEGCGLVYVAGISRPKSDTWISNECKNRGSHYLELKNVEYKRYYVSRSPHVKTSPIYVSFYDRTSLVHRKQVCDRNLVVIKSPSLIDDEIYFMPMNEFTETYELVFGYTKDNRPITRSVLVKEFDELTRNE